MFYIVFVALATPVGVTIGLVVTEHVDASSGVQTLVIGILQVQSGPDVRSAVLSKKN